MTGPYGEIEFDGFDHAWVGRIRYIECFDLLLIAFPFFSDPSSTIALSTEFVLGTPGNPSTIWGTPVATSPSEPPFWIGLPGARSNLTATIEFVSGNQGNLSKMSLRNPFSDLLCDKTIQRCRVRRFRSCVVPADSLHETFYLFIEPFASFCQ